MLYIARSFTGCTCCRKLCRTSMGVNDTIIHMTGQIYWTLQYTYLQFVMSFLKGPYTLCENNILFPYKIHTVCMLHMHALVPPAPVLTLHAEPTITGPVQRLHFFLLIHASSLPSKQWPSENS